MAIDRWPLLAHSLAELVYLALGALFAWEVGAAAWVAVFSAPDACPSAGGCGSFAAWLSAVNALPPILIVLSVTARAWGERDMGAWKPLYWFGCV